MRERKGDLFAQQCRFLCITTNGTVNKDGSAVMGRGVALKATRIWPGIQKKLGSHIKEKGNHVAILLVESSGRAVVSFPVKNNWFDTADLALIEQSCKELSLFIKIIRDVEDICLPRPGCGNGKLKWEDVKPILLKYFDDRFIIVNNEE